MSDRPPEGYARSGQYRAVGPGEIVGALAILDDTKGSIAMGLVADDAIYVCFVGEISPYLARWCARRLERLLDRCHGCSVFLDAHAAQGKNVLGAVARALVSRSRELRQLVCLVYVPAVAATERAVRKCRALVTANPVEFDELLTRAAPQAHETVSFAKATRVTSSVRPPIRLVRSA